MGFLSVIYTVIGLLPIMDTVNGLSGAMCLVIRFRILICFMLTSPTLVIYCAYYLFEMLILDLLQVCISLAFACPFVIYFIQPNPQSYCSHVKSLVKSTPIFAYRRTDILLFYLKSFRICIFNSIFWILFAWCYNHSRVMWLSQRLLF